MSRTFAVVYEAAADFATASELADRVLVEAIDWLDEEGLEYHRTWLSHSPDGGQLTWKRMKRLALNTRVVVEGHFDNQPALPDAKAARRAIVYLQSTFPELDAIVLIRDQDHQPDRRGGLEQARNADFGPIEIVVGLAIVERETWVISGFDPNNDSETALLVEEQQNLGFDPRIKSHQLTALVKQVQDNFLNSQHVK